MSVHFRHRSQYLTSPSHALHPHHYKRQTTIHPLTRPHTLDRVSKIELFFLLFALTILTGLALWVLWIGTKHAIQFVSKKIHKSTDDMDPYIRFRRAFHLGGGDDSKEQDPSKVLGKVGSKLGDAYKELKKGLGMGSKGKGNDRGGRIGEITALLGGGDERIYNNKSGWGDGTGSIRERSESFEERRNVDCSGVRRRSEEDWRRFESRRRSGDLDV